MTTLIIERPFGTIRIRQFQSLDQLTISPKRNVNGTLPALVANRNRRIRDKSFDHFNFDEDDLY